MPCRGNHTLRMAKAKCHSLWLEMHNCEFERGHDNRMFEMLAPGQPQDPARPGTWTTSTLDSQDPGRRWQIYLLMAI